MSQITSAEATNYPYHPIVAPLYLTGAQAIRTVSCYEGAALVFWQTVHTVKIKLFASSIYSSVSHFSP